MTLAFIKSCGLVVAASILCISLIAPAGAAGTGPAELSSAIILSAREVTNGNTLVMQIDTRPLSPPITAMNIKFQEREFPVYQHPVNPAVYRFGLIAVPYRQTPGPANLTLKWTNAAGDHFRKIPFKIVAGNYGTDELQVAPGRVMPNKKNIKRAKKEARRVRQIYADGSIAGLWEGDFQLPLDSEITSSYGNKRLFNRQLKSFHNGVDFRAPVGTPVFAANSGIVKLADDLFYSGKVVIIDHGNLIFTIYAHLSQIDVTSGQQVEKGQLLGLTGATGRVSGPHLHWGVKVHGTAVNPLQFIKIMAELIRLQR